MDEVGIDEHNGKVLVAMDLRYFRPTDVKNLPGDPRMVREKFGWETRTSLLSGTLNLFGRHEPGEGS